MQREYQAESWDTQRHKEPHQNSYGNGEEVQDRSPHTAPDRTRTPPDNRSRTVSGPCQDINDGKDFKDSQDTTISSDHRAAESARWATLFPLNSQVPQQTDTTPLRFDPDGQLDKRTDSRSRESSSDRSVHVGYRPEREIHDRPDRLHIVHDRLHGHRPAPIASIHHINPISPPIPLSPPSLQQSPILLSPPRSPTQDKRLHRLGPIGPRPGPGGSAGMPSLHPRPLARRTVSMEKRETLNNRPMFNRLSSWPPHASKMRINLPTTPGSMSPRSPSPRLSPSSIQRMPSPPPSAPSLYVSSTPSAPSSTVPSVTPSPVSSQSSWGTWSQTASGGWAGGLGGSLGESLSSLGGLGFAPQTGWTQANARELNPATKYVNRGQSNPLIAHYLAQLRRTKKKLHGLAKELVFVPSSSFELLPGTVNAVPGLTLAKEVEQGSEDCNSGNNQSLLFGQDYYHPSYKADERAIRMSPPSPLSTSWPASHLNGFGQPSPRDHSYPRSRPMSAGDDHRAHSPQYSYHHPSQQYAVPRPAPHSGHPSVSSLPSSPPLHSHHLSHPSQPPHSPHPSHPSHSSWIPIHAPNSPHSPLSHSPQSPHSPLHNLSPHPRTTARSHSHSFSHNSSGTHNSHLTLSTHSHPNRNTHIAHSSPGHSTHNAHRPPSPHSMQRPHSTHNSHHPAHQPHQSNHSHHSPHSSPDGRRHSAHGAQDSRKPIMRRSHSGHGPTSHKAHKNQKPQHQQRDRYFPDQQPHPQQSSHTPHAAFESSNNFPAPRPEPETIGLSDHARRMLALGAYVVHHG